jgi:hypothetical protein
MVWDVEGGWYFGLSDPSFYAVVRAGAFGGMTRSMRGRVLGRPAPTCCLRVDIPSI